MKKNFLKKLSFVLASAMVVSVVSPAASAFAATSVKLNATKKYLHLDVEDKNEFDFNIKGKKTGWKYLWESSNEDVAVVNEKNGLVTATGVGTAKVSVVITDKKGKEVDELKATVVVRDNIKEVTFANKPEGDKLVVGDKFDFNRNFVTNSGSTKKTSAITRWSVDPATGATIDDKGVFVATVAGEYTVTARAFQSTEKYNTWKADSAANTALVLDDASYKLTVANAMKDVVQVDTNTVKVTFASAVENVKENLTVSQLVNTSKVKQVIEKIDMSENNTVATVKLYLPLATEKTYVVDFTGMESKNVTAATTKYEDVAEIKVTTTTAEVMGTDVEPTKVEVALFNKDGVNITTDALKARVTMKGADELGTFFDAATEELYIFNEGATAKITATYHTYNYDSLGNEIGALSAVGTVVGVKTSQKLTGLSAWTIRDVGTSDPAFYDVKHVIAAEEPVAKQLFVEMAYDKGSNKNQKLNSKDDTNFRFVSTDETILIIGETTGILSPIRAGAVTVIVSYLDGSGNAVPVATVPITVSPKSAVDKFVVDAKAFNLSNEAAAKDSKTITLTVTDQTGRGKAADFAIEKVAGPKTVTKPVVLKVTNAAGDDIVGGTTAADGKFKVTFNADGVEAGLYTYKIKVGNFTEIISINVQQPNSAATYYKLQLSSTNIDTKAVSWDASTHAQSVTIDLIGYASNNVKAEKVTLAADHARFVVKVDAPSDAVEGFVDDNDNTGSYAVSKIGVDNVIAKAKTGSYKVTAYEKKDGNLVPIDIASFVVSDTQPKAVLSKVVDYGYATTFADSELDANALTIAKAAFEFSVNGTKINGTDNVNIVGVKAIGNANKFNVVSVDVYEPMGANKIKHTVTVGVNLLKK